MLNPENKLDRVNHFRSLVFNLTSQETSKELILACQEFCENFAIRFSSAELDNLLQSLPVWNFSLAHFYLMCVKYRIILNQDKFLNFLVELDRAINQYDRTQILWASNYYCSVFKQISVDAIRFGFELHAIQLFCDAILKLTGGSTGRLTNLHESLFCLCLKAKNFQAALPFMNLSVLEVYAAGDRPLPTSNEKNLENLKLNNTAVLLYFYYGGMILCALERFNEALLFFEHGICLPACRLSAIVLEAFKKYVLVSLITGCVDPIDKLPSYKSSLINRQAIPCSSCYIELVKLVKSSAETKQDIATTLETYLEKYKKVFEEDSNVGLMKRVILSQKYAVLKRLKNIFVALSADDLCKMSFNLTIKEAKILSRQTCYHDKFHIKFDMKQQTFTFHDDNELPMNHEVALDEVIKMSKLVKDFGDLLKLNPAFIAKLERSANKKDVKFVNPQGEEHVDFSQLAKMQ